MFLTLPINFTEVESIVIAGQSFIHDEDGEI